MLESIDGRRIVIAAINASDLPAALLQVGEVSRLVLEASRRDQVYLRIQPHRLVDKPGHRRELQPDQMLACQEPDEIGRGEDWGATD
jgi:hypothetical protein